MQCVNLKVVAPLFRYDGKLEVFALAPVLVQQRTEMREVCVQYILLPEQFKTTLRQVMGTSVTAIFEFTYDPMHGVWIPTRRRYDVLVPSTLKEVIQALESAVRKDSQKKR